MRKIIDAWKRRVPAPLPVFCYAVCLVGWLLASCFGLGRDLILEAAGKLEPFTLGFPVEDQPATDTQFTLVDIVNTGQSTWRTLSDDPQMHWQNPDGRAVRTLRMEAAFSKSPREMCLYYTTRPGEDFSQEKRVFAAQQDDGSYLYTLPAGNITALRLDPCSARDLDMTVTGIFLNEPAGVLSYFAPSWYGAFQMILWPAVAASALKLAGRFWQKIRHKQ